MTRQSGTTKGVPNSSKSVYTTSNHHLKGQPSHHQEAPQAEERVSRVHSLGGSPGHQDNQILQSLMARQNGPNSFKTPRYGRTPLPHRDHKSLCQRHQDPGAVKSGPHNPHPQTWLACRPVQELPARHSPVAKLVKRLLIPHLQEHLPLADHQHGIRKGRSTALYTTSAQDSTARSHEKEQCWWHSI